MKPIETVVIPMESPKLDMQKHECFQCKSSNWLAMNWEMGYGRGEQCNYKMSFMCGNCRVKYTLEWQSYARFIDG